MARLNHIYIWKKAPLLRLLPPLVAGIILEFYLQFSVNYIIAAAVVLAIAFFVYNFLAEALRYQLRALQGSIIFLFVLNFGLLITWQKDVRHHPTWYGNNKDTFAYLVVKINEPPVEKPRSIKALVEVESIINDKKAKRVSGQFLIYFSKDSASAKLMFGDKIILANRLQPIKNSGNPGAFDYARYCAFQQIFQQVYLKQQQWVLVKQKKSGSLKQVIFASRDYILKSLDLYIGGKDEAALAKALLIGYRLDLDKDLVQAYSNAGVVHLIAISGMHLALIYYFLLWVFRKIPFINKSKLLRLVAVLFCLWFFALLTGAPASVLRAAVMFSFIAVGDAIGKKNSVYNSLAISAFVLLCYDPFLLWDVGFQLSYLAVLGIVVSQKHIYHWLYFKNKILDSGWKLASVSLAAQLFTLPVCIYYFHQFPLLFILSNMVAIPLSTCVLWGCILILALSPIATLAIYAGKLVWGLIWLLNHSVVLINLIPFSLVSGLSISGMQTAVLYLVFILAVYGLINKRKAALKMTLVASLVFVIQTGFQHWQSRNQKKIIVYNIARHSAIDFVRGNTFYFVGDKEVAEDETITNYNIKPARIALKAHDPSSMKGIFLEKKNFYKFYHKTIFITDSSVKYQSLPAKIKIDHIIISKNAAIKIADLAQIFDCSHYIFDGSNSPWKIEKWKKECEELHLHFHSVSEQGAFVINL